MPQSRSSRGAIPLVLLIVIGIIVVIAIVGVAVGTSAPTTPGEPPPGCYPAGTQCRVFIQNEVSCCGGQQVVGKRIGWCIGWYDALPCR